MPTNLRTIYSWNINGMELRLDMTRPWSVPLSRQDKQKIVTEIILWAKAEIGKISANIWKLVPNSFDNWSSTWQLTLLAEVNALFQREENFHFHSEFSC